MATDLEKEDGTLDVESANKALDDYAQKFGAPVVDEVENAPPEENTPVETDDKSGDDDAVAKDSDDDDWVSSLAEDMQELVASLGLTDDEVREFSGPEELQRHAHLLDKQLIRMGDKLRPGEEQEAALASQDPAMSKMEAQQRVASQQRGDDGRFVKAETEGSYKPSIVADDYDNELVGEFQRIADHFENRIKFLEQVVQQTESRAREAELQQLDLMIDSLGYDDLFGNSTKVRSSEHKDNRVKLVETAHVLRAGMESLGRNVTVTPSLLKRALNQEFADQLTKKERQNITKRLQDQQKRRLGVGGRKASQSTQSAWSGDPTKDPGLHEAYWQMARESGAL